MKSIFILCLALIFTLSMLASCSTVADKDPSNSEPPISEQPSNTQQNNDTTQNNGQTNPVNTDEVLSTWVNYSGHPDINQKSLNSEKLSIGELRHLPIYKCESVSDLDDFKNQFKGIFSLSSRWDESLSFEEISTRYGEDFFNDNTLLLVYVSANSGSYRYSMDNFSITEGTFCANIIQTNNPMPCTDDMAGWLVIIPISNDEIQNVQSYDAIMK